MVFQTLSLFHDGPDTLISPDQQALSFAPAGIGRP